MTKVEKIIIFRALVVLLKRLGGDDEAQCLIIDIKAMLRRV